MSNNKEEAVINNPTLTTHWCKGGFLWEGSSGSKTDAIAICKENEHNCYVANCSMTMAASNQSLEFKILTNWGCTDKKLDEFHMDNPEQFVDKKEAKQIISKQCYHTFGKMDVPMSNAYVTVPIPAHLCKKAYLSKLYAYNESSDKTCNEFQRYCYLLNCSTVNNANKIDLMTEWGCTDAKYDTNDFVRGTGRALAESYIGSIPSNSMCVSVVTSGTNDGIELPAPSAKTKCKIGRETLNNKTSYGNCAPNSDLCYAIDCNDIEQPTKFVREWGCTFNISNFDKFCKERKSELGYANETLCNCESKFIYPSVILQGSTTAKVIIKKN
ncbi:hypothetical protein niasHS_017369 [Heterodera schachtii]|uniref:SRCR domain-containing protein n=1 Tax=Heterodera schachtii TaxID=97005 RepID=A0ABD2HRY6_HETSC